MIPATQTANHASSIPVGDGKMPSSRVRRTASDEWVALGEKMWFARRSADDCSLAIEALMRRLAG